MQRIRLREADVPDAVSAARSFMRVAGTSHASWWLSELSTPANLEQLLLQHSLRVVRSDYLLDGMLLTTPPPPGPPAVEARAVQSADEFVAATEVQYAAFETSAGHRRSAAELVEEYELQETAEVVRLFAAWVDGRLAAAGRAVFSPRGVLLAGGATAAWARGRGAYRALVRARWDAAVARDTPALVVQAGSMSAPILELLGFETVCRFHRLQDEL